MHNPFKIRYRICQYWTTREDRSRFTRTYDLHYKVEGRNIWTILFDDIWKPLTPERFKSYEAAREYLRQYIHDNHKKSEEHKKVMFEIEP